MFWQVYFSSKGRMARPGFWFATIGILALGFVLTLVSPVVVTLLVALDVSSDIGKKQAELVAGGSWAILAVITLMLVMSGNVGIKRAHDRGKTAQLYVAYLVAIFAISADGLVGLSLWNTVPSILQLAVYAAQLYFLVVFGFLAGDEGPNKYGPNPRDAAAPKQPAKDGPPL